jgi:hypothetical protein
MPSQSQCVDIPVLPHVKNLLLSLYGNEPIKATENNLPGMELKFFFMSADNPREKINGEKIQLRISHRIAPYYHKHSNAFSLGCYFEKLFNMMLFMHVEAQRNFHVQTAYAIKSFFEKYRIDDTHYSYHAATETYRRMKDRVNH